METCASEADRPVHYSTGRLTDGQARTVDRWRARLREDRPLPGQPRISQAARMAGLDDRPRASCSDAIAAAITDLVANGPDPLELARYGLAGIQAGRDAAAGRGRASHWPGRQPVSVYLPAALADKCEQLRAAAYTALLQAHQEAAEAAEAEYPGNPAAMRPDGRTITEARERFAAAELRRRGLPTWVRQVPRGAIARHAIDAWASRTPDQVAAAAVAHAAEHHDQPHRARRDMHDLARSR